MVGFTSEDVALISWRIRANLLWALYYRVEYLVRRLINAPLPFTEVDKSQMTQIGPTIHMKQSEASLNAVLMLLTRRVLCDGDPINAYCRREGVWEDPPTEHVDRFQGGWL